jgi:hypothetical protein
MKQLGRFRVLKSPASPSITLTSRIKYYDKKKLGKRERFWYLVS